MIRHAIDDPHLASKISFKVTFDVSINPFSLEG